MSAEAPGRAYDDPAMLDHDVEQQLDEVMRNLIAVGVPVDAALAAIRRVSRSGMGWA